MEFQTSLGWVGRKKRRICAKEVGSQLKVALESENEMSASVMVTDKKQLDAFRERPFGRPFSEMLRQLKRRVQCELAPHQAFVSLDYVVRGNRLYHLTVSVTCHNSVVQGSSRITNLATR